MGGPTDQARCASAGHLTAEAPPGSARPRSVLAHGLVYQVVPDHFLRLWPAALQLPHPVQKRQLLEFRVLEVLPHFVAQALARRLLHRREIAVQVAGTHNLRSLPTATSA